ncbi:MAG: helix-turn-helix transcriptional regulator [Kurthia sp.]|nr:helix-turn-helix transcriptional regulator [Candidatus Kurthia equi]
MTTEQTLNPICQSYHQAIEFIGKKWVGAILYTLIDKPQRYNEIHARIEGISDRLLTQRLNELIDSKMIEKIYIDNCTKKTLYRLTENGYAFKAVIQAIKQWVQVCEANEGSLK